jgi:hypothetical protein
MVLSPVDAGKNVFFAVFDCIILQQKYVVKHFNAFLRALSQGGSRVDQGALPQDASTDNPP